MAPASSKDRPQWAVVRGEIALIAGATGRGGHWVRASLFSIYFPLVDPLRHGAGPHSSESLPNFAQGPPRFNSQAAVRHEREGEP
jgi:hypothetical protein